MIPELDDPDSWIVCKFGGSSVATAGNWHNIQQIAEERLARGKRVLLVCSALKGVTNLFERLIQLASDEEPITQVLLELEEKHADLGRGLGVDAHELIASDLTELRELVGEVAGRPCPPRLRAAIMAHGELMSTKLGAAFLSARGVPAGWRDAREMMCSRNGRTGAGRQYLSARVDSEPDLALQAELASEKIVVTQGFIARSPAGETVLLGRGGSDTSAALLAGKLSAERLEIWTDVPGMFSANPHQVHDARLIINMTYDEAEALALAGGKVLHPRCIAPARENNIPIYIKCTARPMMPGTIIKWRENSCLARLSAVTSRSGLFWVQAEANYGTPLTMLPRFSEAFLKRDLQVNMVSVGNRYLQATIDPLITPMDHGDINELMTELSNFSDAQIDTAVDSISLVGEGISGLYHELPPLFDSLGPATVRHIGKNSDMDVTLLMSQGNTVDNLVSSLHETLLTSNPSNSAFGPTWQEIQQTIHNHSHGVPALV